MNEGNRPRPLTAREIRKGLRINILAGALGMAFVAVAAGVPITMLLERLGASGVQIGFLVTGQQLAMLAQIPSAWLAGRLPARKPAFTALALAHRLLWFVPALLPALLPHRETTIWWIIGTVSLSALFSQASSPLWYSWISDLVPAKESGRFWGMRQSVVTLSFLAMTALSGVLLDAFGRTAEHVLSLTGFSLVFTLGALLGTADILVHTRVPEPPVTPRPPERAAWRRLLHPMLDRDFRYLTLAIGAWAFSLGVIGSFGLVYLKREFGVTYLQLSLLSVFSSLGAVIAGPAMGLLVDRLGGRAFGAFLLFVCPLTGLAWWMLSPAPVELSLWGRQWSVPQPVILLGAMNLVSGALYSGVGICHMKLLGAMASRQRDRTLAIALHWTLIGLVGAAGPWLGGWIMDHAAVLDFGWILPFGARWSFYHWLILLHALACWTLAAPALLHTRRTQEEPSFATALERLRPGNPLRAVSMVYDMWVAVSAQTSGARARAIRRLGEKRAGFAVRDLIRRLDDPSREVREEAALALGHIGGDEAVAALIEELRDPQSDVALPVARALRAARDPRSVDALVGAMETADRETASESARALGAIGDARATGALRETLRTTRDPKLAGASGEALARLAGIEAIYDILPHIKSAANPILRRTLCVAVGDLLGEVGEFYRILLHEEETPGVEVERMLGEIRAHVRRDETTPADVRRNIVRRTREIQRGYDDGRIAVCADRLLAAAKNFLTLYPAVAHPPLTPMQRQIAERAAVTLWFLDLLNRHWAEVNLGHRDRTDLLLGIYAFFALSRSLRRTGTRRGPDRTP